MQRFYELFGAKDHVKAIRLNAPHSYNRESREAMYAWMARWLNGAPADVEVKEKDFRPDPLPELMVFANRPRPDGVVSTAELTENWISAAKRQLGGANVEATAARCFTRWGSTTRSPAAYQPPRSR